MINQILIPTDFSPAAWQATKLGMELASENGSTLSILHIVPIVSRYLHDKTLPHLPEKIEEIKSKMNELSKELVEETSLKVENVVLPGRVAQTMLDFVRKNNFDLVILGVNSHGGGNDLGSHSTLMIERCNVPVLVVPNTAKSNGAIAS
ncbi:MAG: universal stress protein [Bacteroidota bacterium]